MGEMNINDALGEVFEYTTRTVVPASYYPVILGVGGTGVSDERFELNTATGEQVVVGGGTPYVELVLSVTEGPFAGTEIERRAYVTAGKGGGGLGKWLGAAKAITRVAANTASVCARFGIVLPVAGSISAGPDETPEEAYRMAARAALKEGFFALPLDQRLAFAVAVLNIPAWDGKKVIAKLGIEDYTDNKGKPRSNNALDGFFPLDDPKKGLAWVRKDQFPKQAAALIQMEGK